MGHSFSLLYKFIILKGDYLNDWYHGHYYAKAQNQRRLLRESYDNALRDVDILAMPTTAPKGVALPLIDEPSAEEYIAGAVSHHFNTCPTNLTGHPALSVPCAKVDGLPVGMMLIGRHWEEATVLRVGHAFEALGLYG